MKCLYQARKVTGHVYVLGVMYMCACGIEFANVSTSFCIRFWDCSDSVLFFETVLAVCFFLGLF
jgi:hypothetical protein